MGGMAPREPRTARRGEVQRAARLLLPSRLLDELECDEAGAGVGLSRCPLVSRRHRWLERGGATARRGTGAERRAAVNHGRHLIRGPSPPERDGPIAPRAE